MTTYESYAEYYHDLTKYSPGGIASSQHTLDFTKQPIPFKEYPSKKIIDLSCLLPLDRNPFSDAGIKNPKDFTPREKSLAKLSKLLYFSNGITAVIPHLDKPFYMRAAPSAGGLYPTEIYVCVEDFEGLEDGCYYYSKDGRYLRQVRFKNFRDEIYYLCLGQELGYYASAVIFHTSDLSRAVFKYGERAYRYLHMDAGHLGERINLAALNLNLGVSGIGGFFDDQVNEVLGIPEHEAVVYITTLGVPAKVQKEG